MSLAPLAFTNFLKYPMRVEGFAFGGGSKGKWPNNSEVLDSAQGEISAPPPAVPQLRDSHTPRAESAGSGWIFGVPGVKFT